MTREQIGTSPKKVRGMAQASLDLIEKMTAIIEEIEPVTGRGVGYKLFIAKLIASMSTNDMKRVYRLLKQAREQDLIPWEYIVDETRSLEKVSAWDNPKAFASSVASQYRRDFWDQQPDRVEIWSEKGTIRGVIAPVLDQYGVGFRVMHGFTSATVAHDIAEDDDGRELKVGYIGDWDPSGLWMSECDLPERMEEYGGYHVEIQRIALTELHLRHLPSFPATDKRKDPRYKWFVENYGRQCWEIDALDPRQLRSLVRKFIIESIGDREALRATFAEFVAFSESLDDFLAKVVKASAAASAAINRIHSLGYAAPTGQQWLSYGERAIGTALMLTPWARAFRHLAPNERRHFADLARDWQAGVERNVAQRLGEKTDEEAAA